MVVVFRILEILEIQLNTISLPIILVRILSDASNWEPTKTNLENKSGEVGEKFFGSCNLEVQDILALGGAGSGSSLINRVLCLWALFLSDVLTSLSPSENSSHQNEG